MSRLSSFDEVSVLIQDFEALRVSKAQWTHEAHLAAGLWYLWHLGYEGALSELRNRIRIHNTSVGTPNSDSSGYHETLTRLYLVEIANQSLPKSRGDFESALARVMSSPLASSNWPLSYYTKERLFSTQARKEWCEPDLRSIQDAVAQQTHATSGDR
jgi:hypothetical protein